MQKKVGDVLYVLDLTPYTITEDTDVSIIYVQNEQIKGYKELNTELASKIHGFNQFIMTVLPRPWADGGDDPGPDPEPTGHTFTLSGSDVHSHVDVYFNDVLQEMTGTWTNVISGTSIQIKPKEGYTKEWFGGIQNAEWVDSYNAWFPVYEGNYGMPDTDLTVTIEYIGQPQVEAYLGYLDQENNPHIWEYPTFVREAGTYDHPDITDVTYIYAAQSNGYPLDPNFAVTYTCNEPLVTFDSDGRPHVSSDETTGEYPVGNIPVTITIHDNDGHYIDKQLNYTLRLTQGFSIYMNSYDGSDHASASTTDDLITGDNVYGEPVHCAIRLSYVKVPDGNGDIIPYPMKNEEYNLIGQWPEGSEITYWCDMNNTDIDLHITSEGGTDYDTEPIYNKDSDPHWFTVQLPNETINMSAYWLTQPADVNNLTIVDDVASHNGSNIDENGGRYYSVKFYPVAPASYTNEIKYGFDYEGLNQYSPSDFVFSAVIDSNQNNVQLTDAGSGSYTFSMSGRAQPDSITITISNPS